MHHVGVRPFAHWDHVRPKVLAAIVSVVSKATLFARLGYKCDRVCSESRNCVCEKSYTNVEVLHAIQSLSVAARRNDVISGSLRIQKNRPKGGES